MSNKEKIVEILSDGGNLIIYRSFLANDKNNNPEYIFHTNTNEMDIDEYGDEYGIATTSNFSTITFNLFWEKTVEQYPTVYSLTLKFIHNDYKLAIITNLREKIQSKQLIISELYNLKSWLNNLNILEYELTDTTVFSSQHFMEVLNKYVKRNFQIMEQYGWNRIDLNHSNFKSVQYYKEFLSENNIISIDGFKNDLRKAGIYAYFNAENCLYIGKAKKIEDRLISHFKSSRGFIKKSNPNDGKRHREMFGFYKNTDISIFYLEVDDKYKCKTGELLRKTFEGMLQLEYKPEFEYKIDYTK